MWALDERRWLVDFALRETAFFATGAPEHDRSADASDPAGERSEFSFEFAAKISDTAADVRVGLAELVLHGPERGSIGLAQFLGFALVAFTDASVGMIPILAPALQRGAADAVDAGAVAFEIAAEGPVQEVLGVVARDGGVLEIEFVLAVDVGQVDAGSMRPCSASR